MPRKPPFRGSTPLERHQQQTKKQPKTTNPPFPTNPGTPHHPHPKEHQVRYAVLRPSPCGIPHQPRVWQGWELGGRKVSLHWRHLFCGYLGYKKNLWSGTGFQKKTWEGKDTSPWGKKFLILMFLDPNYTTSRDVFPSAMGKSSEIVTNTDGFRHFVIFFLRRFVSTSPKLSHQTPFPVTPPSHQVPERAGAWRNKIFSGSRPGTAKRPKPLT